MRQLGIGIDEVNVSLQRFAAGLVGSVQRNCWDESGDIEFRSCDLTELCANRVKS